MGLTDLQVYNLIGGLVVVVVLFGGLGIYALTHGTTKDTDDQPKPRVRH